ncbi:hypothetical protein BDR04DRAFT_1122337 [Suillus decipiens]|nr:hypothetical protein BDR04DRAFT_1122337 [Suillus decipiens]
MDYALCHTAWHNMEGITRVITFYDINYQYNKHFWNENWVVASAWPSRQLLCVKYKLAKNGTTESGRAFDRLDEAASGHLKTEWLAKERVTQSSRIRDPAVMDLYEINIKKDEYILGLLEAPSKKEIELRLLEDVNTCNAAPPCRSVAMWISMGLAIEEAQIALLIKI